MKKMSLLSLGVLILWVAGCGDKAPAPLYQPDSKEYEFFQKLSEKAPILNPDESNKLVEAKSFSVYTNDIMPIIYRQWSRHANNMAQIPDQQISQFVYYAAAQQAERKLLEAAAEKNNISVSQDTLEAEMQKIYASSGGEEKFAETIQQQGLTLEYVKKDVKSNLLATQYLQNMVFDTVTVEEEEVKIKYQEPKTATVRHILLMTQGKSEDEKAEIRNQAEELVERAKSGEDFAELAKQYSEDPGSKEKGGLYEDFPKGRMVKSFEDASFNLPIGSISDVVETEYGYHVIKIVDRKKETKPLEEVQGQLEQTLLREKKNQVYDAVIESLKEKSDYKEIYTI
ncbi:hypothetical protein GF406_13080 [candidate division KSB1 bacterium]|nr:hypothetical protein [candidate division KSB1 bacterium]